MRFSPPEDKGAGYDIQINDKRNSGSSKARTTFKDRIRKTIDMAGEEKRQRSEEARNDPSQEDEEAAVRGIKPDWLFTGDEKYGQGNNENRPYGDTEGSDHAPLFHDDGNDERNYHGKGNKADQEDERFEK
jgi:hypothetical protein